ncbi:MAG: hypothetical protein IKR25_13250, partial [Muribaculaceae bacterium]|nr:hypothetical protein [Muribaculaceae bacterium]
MKKLLLTLLVVLGTLCASGQTFDVALLRYTIDSDGTARVLGLSTAGASASPTTITIPGRVTYNSKTYRVDVIGTEAFKNNTKV